MPDYGDKGGFQGSGKGGNPGNSGAGYGSNKKGTPYSKQLGEAIARANMRNAPDPVSYVTQSVVQERGGYTHGSVSPGDLAGMAGMMAQSNNFGGQNNKDVQRAMDNAYSRAGPGAGERGVLGSYNLGMGINPTTDMGLIDSLKYNTIDQPGFMNQVANMGVGLLGNMVAPGLGTVIGLLNRDKRDQQKNMNMKMAKVDKDKFSGPDRQELIYGS